MIDNLIVFAVILMVVWVLGRWGWAIFMVYAVAHFVAGQWLEAGFALFIAWSLSLMQGLASWFWWNAHGRAAWLASRHFRRFPL